MLRAVIYFRVKASSCFINESQVVWFSVRAANGPWKWRLCVKYTWNTFVFKHKIRNTCTYHT